MYARKTYNWFEKRLESWINKISSLEFAKRSALTAHFTHRRTEIACSQPFDHLVCSICRIAQYRCPAAAESVAVRATSRLLCPSVTRRRSSSARLQGNERLRLAEFLVGWPPTIWEGDVVGAIEKALTVASAMIVCISNTSQVDVRFKIFLKTPLFMYSIYGYRVHLLSLYTLQIYCAFQLVQTGGEHSPPIEYPNGGVSCGRGLRFRLLARRHHVCDAATRLLDWREAQLKSRPPRERERERRAARRNFKPE